MGKTTLSERFIKGSTHDRVVIFDHQDEFAARLGIPSEQVAYDENSFIRLLEENRIVPFDFEPMFPGGKQQAFEWFCGFVFDVCKIGLQPLGKECLIVCDELQQFVNKHTSPMEFKQILETGRRYGLDSLSLSRAPNRVNDATREEFTEIFLFRLNDDNSLNFVEGMGADVEQVRALNEHEYLYFNVMSGRERKDKLQFAGKRSVVNARSAPGINNEKA